MLWIQSFRWIQSIVPITFVFVVVAPKFSSPILIVLFLEPIFFLIKHKHKMNLITFNWNLFVRTKLKCWANWEEKQKKKSEKGERKNCNDYKIVTYL